MSTLLDTHVQNLQSFTADLRQSTCMHLPPPRYGPFKDGELGTESVFTGKESNNICGKIKNKNECFMTK